MKPFKLLTGSLFFAYLITAIFNIDLYSQEMYSIRAGTARINITPEVPIPMSGYRSRTEPFKGIHDSIYARAIVFSDGENKAVIISAEIIGLSNSFCEDLSILIEESVGIKKEFILVTVVHNHSGPVTQVYSKNNSEEVEAYVEDLQQNLIKLVVDANANLQPASIGAGKGECRMNINRRAPDGKGNIQLGRNPYGPCDHEVGIVRIDDAKGNLISVLLNWPCHAVVMGPRNHFISGDWPGATSRYIEDSLGNTVMAPIVIGASGDINPIYGPHIDFEDVNSYAFALDAIAFDLGNEAISVLKDINTRSTGTIRGIQSRIFLPGKDEQQNRLHHKSYNPGNDVEVLLSVIKIGDLIFFGINGEVFNQIGVKLRDQSPHLNTFVFTHCNGSSGYLVSDKAIAQGGYEVKSTSVQSGAEKGIIEGLLEMLESLEISGYNTGQVESIDPVYLVSDQPVNRRVEDLLSMMTLEEKVGQMNWPCVYMDGFGEDIPAKKDGVRKFVTGNLLGIGPGGGFFTLANEISRDGTRQQAEVFNELQKLAIEQTRLKIPLMQVEEGTHGLMAPGATIFPEGLGLGATWNKDLIKEVYSAAAEEARSVGVHQLFTIVIEPNRDPRHGRNQQTFSEDPFLCSRYAEAVVAGAQGSDISAGDKVVAGLCHYPGQTQGLNGINRGTMDISERTLKEVFLPPWEAGIRNAGALGVMATHPSINGYPNHGSEKHLTSLLRHELGFEGIVLSEGSNTGTLVYERVVATEKEAGPIVLKAGVDVNITFESGYMEDMIENVNEGNVSMDLIDRAVRRILRLKFQMGLFENPFVDVERAVEVVHNPDHTDLALEAARESMVLLKNENSLLPLDRNVSSIAVIGPNADDPENLLGDYIPKKLLNRPVTILEAIRSKVSPQTEIYYVKGCNVLDTALNEISAAREVAGKADIAIVVVGEDERTDGESDDTADLDLTGYQSDLIKAVHGTGTPTIVVLISGRPLTIRWTAEHAPAIIEAWMCGERGGEAIADIIFGDYNPSGRLPITFPRHVGQMPFYYNYKPAKFNRQQRAYVTYPLTPLWEFGYGLSYTKFEYSNLQISSGTMGTNDTVKISLDVTNAGHRAGKEVVQLYLDDVISSVVTPVIELRGFEKILLEPGEMKSVHFQLTPYDLSMLNMSMERIVEPGTFEVMAGHSSTDIRLRGSFEIEAEEP